MSATDTMIRRLEAEVAERDQLMQGLVAGAEEGNRDLSDQELEIMTRAKERVGAINGQLNQLRDASRVTHDSRERIREVDTHITNVRSRNTVGKVEYRSAGQYINDLWFAHQGNQHGARDRLEVFDVETRAAAHQTTADNSGLIPRQIMGPVIDYVDTARPVVSALVPRDLPSGSWSRPRVTQHTQVTAQSAEKAELSSRKMLISAVNVNPVTYGGYVNVSRQNIDFSNPQIMDIIVNDMAGQYAIETEAALADYLNLDANNGVAVTYPATPNAAQFSGSLWSAAAAAFTAMQGQGRLILAVAPNMLGLVGPLFAPVNPQNAQSTGFSAGQFGTGAMGAISGITVVMSAGMDPGTALVINSAAVEVYEDRIGSLQATEPSVLGIQVAYAGYFVPIVLNTAGIVPLTQAI